MPISEGIRVEFATALLKVPFCHTPNSSSSR